MDKQLYDAVKASQPTFNRYISEGPATFQLDLAMSYINRVIRCAEAQFPADFEFDESNTRICTPEEEWQQATEKTYNKYEYELSDSDVYLVKYQFKWKGKPLKPTYIYLPYVREGGLISLRGVTYTISPILADLALSVADNGVFMPFLRDSSTFKQVTHAFQMGQKAVNPYVTVCPLHAYARSRKDKGLTSCLPHYLFCKYGVYDTFKRFYNTVVKIIDVNEYNPSDYPEDTWTACQSMGLPPKQYGKRPYTKPPVVLLVKKTQFSEGLAGMVAGFFYVLDYFAFRVNSTEHTKDMLFWQVLMGKIISKKEEISEGKLLNDVEKHLSSLDKYIDSEVRESLAQTGVYVNDIYELFVYMQNNISDMLKNADLSNTYGKRLQVLPYVLRNIVEAIFKLAYELNSNQRNELRESVIAQYLGRHLNRSLIFKLSPTRHREINIITSPNDSKIASFTSHVVQQGDATANRKNKQTRTNLNDPSKRMHSSLIEGASYLNQPKSDPTSRSSGNAFMKTSSDGTFIQNHEIKGPLEKMNKRLRSS